MGARSHAATLASHCPRISAQWRTGAKMSQAPVLTGQDIAEAQGAVTRLLERSLAATNTSRVEYVTLRVLVVRGPFTSPDELHDYLAGQPQLGLTPEATAELLAGLEEQGLAAGTALG